jgi:prefoldin beta subunit
MKSDTNTQQNQSIQEIGVLEHNLHSILMQKQAFQLELNETLNAMEEVKKTNDEVYKMTGSILIKSNKEKILKELEEKNKVLELRVSSLDKQESLFESKLKEIREDLIKNSKN